MKKKAVALALGALFAAPSAHSQITFGNETIGTVQIYGRLYPQFASFKSSGATPAGASVSTLVSTTGVLAASGAGVNVGRTYAIETNSSRIGFRGERRLGAAGLKALWQIEQQIVFDNPDEEGEPWASRDSFVGLGGNFGSVRLGFMRTVYRTYGGVFNMFGIRGGNFVSSSNVISHIGVGSNRSARFHERRKNSVYYETPEFAGFQAAIMYSPNERKGDPSVAPTGKDSLWSGGVKYEAGPFYVALAHEIHNNFFGGSNNVASALRNLTDPNAESKDTATRLSFQYRLGRDHRFTGEVAQLRYKERGQTLAAPRFESYRHNTWTIGWEARWGGPWSTGVEYARGEEGQCTLTGGAACSTSGLKGSLLSAGVAYSLDRQTLLYFIAARLTNGPSTQYDNWDAGTPARGADTTQMALGIRYDF